MHVIYKFIIFIIYLLIIIFYLVCKIGASVFGKFKIDKYLLTEAMKNAKAPIIFFHGNTDNFVPYYMSEQNYDKCISRKD